MKARSEDSPSYGAKPTTADDVIAQALFILEDRMRRDSCETFSTPSAVKDYAKLKFAELEHEMFTVLWLDAQHRLLEVDEMFRGTLTQTSVFPREVLKAALRVNAGACIFIHNHPSGLSEPSRADHLLTNDLKSALILIEVRVLDHIVVGGDSTVSFAERGLI